MTGSVKRKPKKFKNFRFSDHTINRLKRFAGRKKVSQTEVMEALIERYCTTASEEKNGKR